MFRLALPSQDWHNIQKDVFRLRLVNSLVIAPGSDRCSSSSSSRAVMATNHTNSGIRSGFILFGYLLIVVEIKFTAPRISCC
jgi:hypothetical protein